MPRRNVWVTKEVEQLIKELDINLSGFINEELPIRFSPIQHTRKEIHGHSEKIKELKDKFKKLEKERGNAPGISRDMIATLKEMHQKLKENPEYFTGMLKTFRNEFSTNLSQNEFRKLLKTYGGDEGLTKEQP